MKLLNKLNKNDSNNNKNNNNLEEMGGNVKRLALIDAERFNNLMELLQSNAKRQKIVDDATHTPEESGLVESHNNMISSVKNKSSLAGTNIINFLNKKGNFQKSLQVEKDEGTAEGATNPAAQPPVLNGKPGMVANHTNELMNI